MALIDNLLAYWRFEEASGAVDDAHTGGYDGTNNGADYQATGIINYAYNYVAGSSDYVEIDNEEAMRLSGGSYTISLWFKADSTGDSRIIWKSWSTTGQADYDLYFSSNTLNWRMQDDTATANGASSTGTWYHIVLVRDLGAETMTLYIDSVAQNDVGSSTATTVTGNDNEEMQLARYYYGTTAGGYFDGIIDEVGIWTRALTSGEVGELYNSGNGFAYPFTAPAVGNLHMMGANF